MPSQSSRTVIRGTSIVSSLTLLSRLLGLLREVVFARLFGAGWVADAFFVAFRIPNLLRSLLAEGALTSAFVPIFAGEEKKGTAAAQAAFSSTVTLLLLTTALVSVLGIIFAPLIVALMAPGFGLGSEKMTLCITLTRIMLPYIAFVSLVAVINGALNTKKIFGAAPLAQVVMNLCLTLAALAAGIFDERSAVIFLAAAVIVGGALEILVQRPALRRAQLKLQLNWRPLIPPIKQMLFLMLPALLGAAVYEVNIFINTLLASLLESGSVAWLSYADRVAQLPIGVFTIALVSVLLPTLARAAAAQEQANFASTLQNGLRYTSFIMLPFAAALFFYAEPLVALLFERGAFSSYATAKTALAVRAMAFGLWGYSCYSLTIRAFFARRDTLTPALVGVFSLLSGLALSLLLMGPPQQPLENPLAAAIGSLQTWLQSLLPHFSFGHAGLALSSGLAVSCSFALLVFLLNQRAPGLHWWSFHLATLRSLAAAAFMLLTLHYWHQSFPPDLLGLLSGSLIGTLAYALASFILGSLELKETSDLARRVLRKKNEGLPRP